MNFELTVDEANVILGGLAKLPYEVSAGVINKLQTQAQGQIPANAEQDSVENLDAVDED
jgi:hypothetical protein